MCARESPITKMQAESAYKRLCEKYNGDPEKTGQCILYEERMLSELGEDGKRILDALIRYRLTERQGGGYVI